jgi:CspA family cold shock protein
MAVFRRRLMSRSDVRRSQKDRLDAAFAARGRVMKGTVKWFSQEKGYGFIVGEDGAEYYCHVTSVRGASLPSNGAQVSFVAGSGKKGPAAQGVEILVQPVAARDDRIACPHCNKQIVPRIITDRGSLSHSVCPFCGGTIAQFRAWWPWVLGLALIFVFFLLVVRG